jgi:hypothetical protein
MAVRPWSIGFHPDALGADLTAANRSTARRRVRTRPMSRPKTTPKVREPMSRPKMALKARPVRAR